MVERASAGGKEGHACFMCSRTECSSVVVVDGKWGRREREDVSGNILLQSVICGSQMNLSCFHFILYFPHSTCQIM